MATVSPTTVNVVSEGCIYLEYYGTSGADTSAVMTSTVVAARHIQKIVQITVAYSAAPTQTGVIIEIDNGIGAGYDTTLTTGSANARYTNYSPTWDVVLMPGDAIRVTAPQAGGVITSSITIVLQDI